MAQMSGGSQSRGSCGAVHHPSEIGESASVRVGDFVSSLQGRGGNGQWSRCFWRRPRPKPHRSAAGRR